MPNDKSFRWIVDTRLTRLSYDLADDGDGDHVAVADRRHRDGRPPERLGDARELN